MPKYSEEANRLWPYLLKKIERVSGIGGGGGASGSVGVGGAPTPHSMDGVHHTGTISNAQGPQFLLTDGTRQLTGNLAVTAGATIDGVDLSAHAADPNAHHDAATAGNTAISLTGQAISLVVASSGGLQVSGAGVHIDLDSTPGLVLGSGGIKVLLDPTASGLQLTSGLALADSIAGAGLGIASKVLAVNVGDGMEIAADAVAVDLATNSGLTFSSGDLAMGTPTAVSAISINNVTTTTHVHAVTASSNVGTSAPGVDMLLKSTSAGGLTLGSLTVTGAATVDQGLTAGNTGFRVIYHTHDYNHVHTVINPGGGWSLDEQFGLDIDDNLLVRGWIVGKHAIQIDEATMILHFDGPDRVGDLSGQTVGHMGQVPTSKSGITFAPGKFGKAVQTPRATTNLVDNPSFEVGTTGWSNYSTGAATGTRTRVTTEAYAGSYSYELVKVTGAVGERWGASTSVSVTSGTTYTVSAWVYIVSSVGGTQIFAMETGGALSGTTTSIAGATQGWTRITRTMTASSTGNGLVFLYVANASDMTVHIDAVQVEAVAYATAYCDGSLGTGHSWSGTAHASTSSRTAATLYYNTSTVLYQRKGSVMAWAYPTVNSVGQMVFYQYTSGGMIYIRANAAGVWGYAFAGSEVATATAVTANTWAHVALTWEDSTINFYVDGALVDTRTLGPWTAGLQTAFAIGSEWGGTSQNFSGLIDDVVILKRAATADEVRAIVESNAPVFAETSTWHWRSARNRIYADSEGLWGIGASGQTILGLYAGDEEDAAATKSWGGMSLAESDLLLGDASRGAYFLWDNSLGNIEIGSDGASSARLLLDSTDIHMYINSVDRFHLSGTNGLILMRDGAGTTRFALSSAGTMQLYDSGGAAVFTFNTAAGAEFTKSLTLGTSGGIYQGTGTFASPTKGLKIWSESDGSNQIGRIAGYNGGTLQWGADTNGRLVAGGNNVILNSLGIRVIVGSTPIDNGSEMSQANAIKMVTSGGADVGWMTGAGTGHIALAAAPPTGESQLYLMANPQDISWGGGAVWPQITLDAGTTAGSVITLDGQDIFIGHSTSSPTDIVLRGQVNATDATFNVVGATGLITGSSLRATGDAGGAASTTTFTNVVNASANSTGVGSVKMKGATSRDSAGFIKIFVGTTAYYIPYWSAVTG